MAHEEYNILRRLKEGELPVRKAGSLEATLEQEVAKGTVRKVKRNRFFGLGPSEERYQITGVGEEYLKTERINLLVERATGRPRYDRPTRSSYASTQSSYRNNDDWTTPSILDTGYTSHHSTHDTGFGGFGGGDSGGAGASDSWGGGDFGGGDCGGGDCGGGGE